MPTIVEPSVERAQLYYGADWINAARDLTLEAARDAGASRRSGGSAARQLSASQIKKLLDSRNERDVLEGLRRVVAVRMISRCPSKCISK